MQLLPHLDPLLFVMELKTRRVHFVGCTTSPHEFWMKQTDRELTNFEEGFFQGQQHLITDRDPKFCEAFNRCLARKVCSQSADRLVRPI